MVRANVILSLIALWWGGSCLAQPLHIRVLDVDEGQAVLLHQGQRAVLIDTGHAGQVASVLARMQALGIQHLDYLFITHLHPDHASGYFRVLEAFPQVEVRDNCYPLNKLPTSDMMRWVDEAMRVNSRRRCVKSGDRIEWGGADVNVLWPLHKPARDAGYNHTSLVIEVSFQGKRLLIMGDADKRAEARLLQENRLQPVDILVVGHHGADDASSEEFIAKIAPRVSIVSINEDNLRGYPSAEVLTRLQDLGSQLYTTYERGEVHFVFED